MHRPIKKFSLSGTIRDDSDFIRIREQYENMLVIDMREEGCVPVLGLGPLWSTSFNEDNGDYSFELSMYGVSVGRKKSLKIEGMDVNGALIHRPIQDIKSKKYSPPVE